MNVSLVSQVNDLLRWLIEQLQFWPWLESSGKHACLLFIRSGFESC